MIKTIKYLFERGKYQEILEKITQLETQGELASLVENEQVECVFYHSLALLALGQVEQGLQLATTTYTKIRKTDNIKLLLALLSAQVHALLELGRSDKADSLITEGDTLLRRLSTTEEETGSLWIYFFKFTKGVFFNLREKTDLALDHFRQALAGFEILNTPDYIAWTLSLIGYIYYEKGEHDTALEYYQRSFKLYERLDHKSGMTTALLNIGHIYMRQGDHNTMLEYYKQSLITAEESNNPIQTIYPLNCVGYAYAFRSKLDIALEYCQRALALSETKKSNRLIAAVAHTTGIVFHMRGEFDDSLNCFQRSLTLNEAHGNIGQVTQVLHFLIRLLIDRKDLIQARSHLTKLQKINTQNPNKKTHFYTRLAEALVLKQSPRIVNKAQAQTILKQIVTEEAFKWRWNMAIFGLLHLCELLIFEAKATGEVEAWEETKAFIHQFYTQAQYGKDLKYIGEFFLLKAKIAMIEGELRQAQTFLDQAKTFATENNLLPLKDKAETEQQRLEVDFEKWNELIRSNASLQKRLQQARLEEYLQKAQQLINY